MRATLDALARFGDGLLTLATAVEGLAERLRLRLRLRGAGLGVRLRTDLCTSKKQPEKQSDARLPRSCRRRCKIQGGPRPAAGPGEPLSRRPLRKASNTRSDALYLRGELAPHVIL